MTVLLKFWELKIDKSSSSTTAHNTNSSQFSLIWLSSQKMTKWLTKLLSKGRHLVSVFTWPVTHKDEKKTNFFDHFDTFLTAELVIDKRGAMNIKSTNTHTAQRSLRYLSLLRGNKSCPHTLQWWQIFARAPRRSTTKCKGLN